MGTHLVKRYLGSLFKVILGFPGGSEVKASACNAGDLGLIPGLGRSPGEGNGSPLQFSRLKNSTDREAPQSLVGYSPRSRKESEGSLLQGPLRT